MKYLLKTLDLSLVGRLNESILKNYYRILKISLVLLLFSLMLDWSVWSFFALISLVFFVIIILRVFAFRNYITEVLDSGDDEIILHQSVGFFKKNTRKIRLKKGNFKVTFFENTRFMSGYTFEQTHPYKFITRQYCFGVWKDKKSVLIFNDFASVKRVDDKLLSR